MKKPTRKARARTTKAAKGAPKKNAKPSKKSRAVDGDVHKFEAVRPGTRRKTARKTAARSDIDNLGELPRSYGDERIFVIAQEPHRLFCYWDYRLTDGIGSTVFLRHSREGQDPEGEVALPRETNNWYLSVREADADYAVELGCYENGAWRRLTRSAAVLTPSDKLAGPGHPVFANVPFHASFQKLVEKLRGRMRRGESLAAALARLQKTGAAPVASLSADQRTALSALLDTGLGSLGSGDLGRLLSSPGASLFSGGFAPSSWGTAASWPEAAGGFSSGFLALTGPAGASLGSASWSGAASGWSSDTVSSWGAESSRLSSWAPATRGFFMHVNAEVIFYGGTHPDAKVTVAGKPVDVRPDGTFRYHFVLPDGEFEIPVVATSPDGAETRRAVLEFGRATQRRGEVGATAQPPLGAPMGRKK